MHLHGADCSNSMYSCSVTIRNNEASGVFAWHFNWTYFWFDFRRVVSLWRHHVAFLFTCFLCFQVVICTFVGMGIYCGLVWNLINSISRALNQQCHLELSNYGSSCNTLGCCSMLVESSCQLQVFMHLLGFSPLHLSFVTYKRGRLSLASEHSLFVQPKGHLSMP